MKLCYFIATEIYGIVTTLPYTDKGQKMGKYYIHDVGHEPMYHCAEVWVWVE